jgi:hypothetical protein
MGQYEGTARGIVGKIVAERREKASEDQSRAQTANNLVGNLQEFAKDVNAALKEAKLDSDIKIKASPWEAQMTSVVSIISITNGDREHEIRVEVPDGAPATVDGAPARPGSSAMAAIVSRILGFLT